MAQNKRWGKPYEDKRNWSDYNEKLVIRGEFYLSLEFLAKWDSELLKMNINKRGRQYQYPLLFIQWVAAIHIIFSALRHFMWVSVDQAVHVADKS